MSTFGLPWAVATRKRSICSPPKMLKCFQFRMWLAVQFWFWVAKWISCQNMFTEWSLEWNAAKVINHVFLLFEFKSECYFELEHFWSGSMNCFFWQYIIYFCLFSPLVLCPPDFQTFHHHWDRLVILPQNLSFLHLFSEKKSTRFVTIFMVLSFEIAFARGYKPPKIFLGSWHESMYALKSSGNKHFFTKSWHRQTYKNYEQSRQTFGKF